MMVARGRVIGSFVFWAIVFGVSYTQAPLYYSNQNQYFLHGLADAGEGDLQNDWLASTRDPTPLFSELVAFTAGHLHEWFFYGYYLLILGLYFYSLVALFTLLTPNAGPAARLCFMALFVLVHAGILRLASARLFGVDYPWFLQAGVAGQYVLGFGLQPSVAGVFLIASMVAFLRERPWRAVVLACLAGILHATYLPAAALLTLAYMLAVSRGQDTAPPYEGEQDSSPPYEGGAGGGWPHAGRLGRAALLGGFALVLVLPSVIYNLATFAPTSPESFADAQHILAHIRIPHHAVITRWFDGIACAQILWIVLGMYFVPTLTLSKGVVGAGQGVIHPPQPPLRKGGRNTFKGGRNTLMLLMLVPFLGSLLLTLLQLGVDNDTLALLFPWRTSVILVPIATTVMLSWLVQKMGPWLEVRRQVACGLCSAILAGCVAGGLAISYFELGYHSNRDEVPLLEFVRTHHQPGDVYLIPVEVAKPKAGVRGVTSSNFMPAPTRGKAGAFIAVDLQGFRLTTGAPIYVDFKSIPYKDEEVLEWDRRVLWCIAVYAKRLTPATALRAELSRNGITHVVAPAATAVPFMVLGEPLYRDETYCVFPVAKK